MAATTTATIPLGPVTSPSPPAQNAVPPTPPGSGASHSRPAPGATGSPALSANSAGPQTPPPPAQQSNSFASSSATATTSIPNDPHAKEETLWSRIRKLKPKTLLEILVGTFAIFGVIWATFVSLPGLRLQKWSARNDFLQACLSLDSPSTRSMSCNETISAGPLPPPRWKRGLHNAVGTVLTDDPLILATTVVLTVAVVVASTIYFRPKMEPFRPVISMVRAPVCEPTHVETEPQGPQNIWIPVEKVTKWSKMKWGEPTGDIAWMEVYEETTILPDQGDCLHVNANNAVPEVGKQKYLGIQGNHDGLGKRIGVFYDSDEDSIHSHEEQDDSPAGVWSDSSRGSLHSYAAEDDSYSHVWDETLFYKPLHKIERTMSCPPAHRSPKDTQFSSQRDHLRRGHSCPQLSTPIPEHEEKAGSTVAKPVKPHDLRRWWSDVQRGAQGRNAKALAGSDFAAESELFFSRPEDMPEHWVKALHELQDSADGLSSPHWPTKITKDNPVCRAFFPTASVDDSPQVTALSEDPDQGLISDGTDNEPPPTKPRWRFSRKLSEMPDQEEPGRGLGGSERTKWDENLGESGSGSIARLEATSILDGVPAEKIMAPSLKLRPRRNTLEVPETRYKSPTAAISATANYDDADTDLFGETYFGDAMSTEEVRERPSPKFRDRVRSAWRRVSGRTARDKRLREEARYYPEIPGESIRNPRLEPTRETYRRPLSRSASLESVNTIPAAPRPRARTLLIEENHSDRLWGEDSMWGSSEPSGRDRSRRQTRYLPEGFYSERGSRPRAESLNLQGQLYNEDEREAEYYATDPVMAEKRDAQQAAGIWKGPKGV